MLLKEIAVNIDQNEEDYALISREALCIEDLFMRELNHFENERFKKLVIRFVGNSQMTKEKMLQHQIAFDDPIPLLNVLEIWRRFDFESYRKTNDYKKKLMILDCIYNSFLIISKNLNWNDKIFDRVYEKCIQSELNNTYFIVKNKSSPDKKKTASVMINFTISSFETFVIFNDSNKKEMLRSKIFSLSPIAADRPFFDEIKWIGNDELKLKHKYSDKFWIIPVNS